MNRWYILSLLSTDHLNAGTCNTALNALLSETSTEVLAQIFGKKTAKFLAWRLGIYQASQNDSVNLSRATAFSNALHRVFGSGANAIELLILRYMYSKSGTSFSPLHEYSFEDHVNALQYQIAEALAVRSGNNRVRLNEFRDVAENLVKTTEKARISES